MQSRAAEAQGVGKHLKTKYCGSQRRLSPSTPTALTPGPGFLRLSAWTVAASLSVVSPCLKCACP